MNGALQHVQGVLRDLFRAVVREDGERHRQLTYIQQALRQVLVLARVWGFVGRREIKAGAARARELHLSRDAG